MIVAGSPKEKQYAAELLEKILAPQPYAVLTGSLGRAAIYEAYDYNAPPLSLQSKEVYSGYRDIDVLFTVPGLYSREAGAEAYHWKHAVDLALQARIQRNPDGHYGLVGYGKDRSQFWLPLDPTVAAPVSRELLGVPVPTLSVGTQLQVERMYPDAGKYAESKRVFRTFAESIKETAPHEFLPDASYAPFDEYVERHVSL
jgi:hypothetical protein